MRFLGVAGKFAWAPARADLFFPSQILRYTLSYESTRTFYHTANINFIFSNSPVFSIVFLSSQSNKV
jgi:hypothetical protein